MYQIHTLKFSNTSGNLHCVDSVDSVDIILRTCDREFRGTQRWTGNKHQTVIGCLTSVIESALLAHNKGHTNLNMTWLDDQSSDEMVKTITSILRNHWPGQVTRLTTDQTGNGSTYGICVDYAKNHCRNLIYFLEDDYIHLPITLQEMVESWYKLSADLNQDVVLFPVDYIDRYQNHGYCGLGHPSGVYLGSDRHWRSAHSTTGTFWMHYRTLNQYFDWIYAMRDYGINPHISESNTINRVYEHVPCLSPLPGLAEHVMQQPSYLFVDWQQRWNNIQSLTFDS